MAVAIVYVLLGIYPASNCSWPTFRNPVSVPSSKAGCRVLHRGKVAVDVTGSQIPHILLDSKFHCWGHENPPVVAVLS